MLAKLLVQRDKGMPLRSSERSAIEEKTGQKLDRVRVHTARASHVTADLFGVKAFTIGKDVFLGREVNPGRSRADRKVLEHELIHTLQQPAWTGAPLSLGAPDSEHERDASRVANSLQGDHVPILPIRVSRAMAMTALPPLVLALIGGILACMFGFFIYGMTKMGRRSDAFLHCWTSCKIGTWCPPVPLASQIIAALIGAIKELVDIVIGEAEVRDMVNNLHGIACSARYFTSCTDCCEDKERRGILAGVTDRATANEEAIATTQGPAGDTGMTGAAAAALASEGLKNSEVNA